jgi:hypothetical protein
MFKITIGIFSAIFIGSLWLLVILVRSRHAFSVRPFHSCICVYFAIFALYSLLKSAAVGRLLVSNTQAGQLTAGLMLNGTFMMFFWLGFGGNMALIQLWMRMTSRHTSGGSEHSLTEGARRTWRRVRIAVLVVCLIYLAGFVALVGMYSTASSDCAAAADSADCIPVASSGTPAACQRALDLARGVVYYEGVCAAVVAVVFTFYALVFNGLVYAILTSDTYFANLTKLQLIIISNPALRWMLRLYARPSCLCLATLRLLSPAASGIFPLPGGRPRARRRMTCSSGALACAPSASSSPSSACAVSRARLCWWRCISSASRRVAAACHSACRCCSWRRCHLWSPSPY